MQPDSSDRFFQSVMRPAQICRMSFQMIHWAPYRRAVTLALMTIHVYPEIQSHLTRSRRGAWGSGS